MSVAVVLPLCDGSGRQSYAVWVGTSLDPTNKRRVLNPRLLGVFAEKKTALFVADNPEGNAS